MDRSVFTAVLVRFWSGTLGATAAGLVAFRLSVLEPQHLAFQCITIGGLTAGLLTLMRSATPGGALVLAAGFALLRLGAFRQEGLLQVSSGLVLAGGIYVAALVFDLLARRGLLFGKFLVLGPLVGGAYFAAAPLLEFGSMVPSGALRTLLEYVFLGVVIGNGVGLGVEIADLALASLGRRGADGEDSAAQGRS